MTEAAPSKAALQQVALVAVVAHATAIGAGFVWLDHAHIEERLALAPAGSWFSLFTRPFAGTGFYRPLMALSLSLDAAITNNPAFFHAVTLAWHAAAAVMLVLAARRLGSSARAATAAGLLFAAHPLTSLVASAIAFRSEAMTLTFLLCLVVAHLAQKPLWAALALGAAALSKETGWLLSPLFIAALELTRDDGEPRSVRLLASEAAAFTLCTALRLVYAPEHRASFPELTLDQNLGMRLGALGKGLVQLVFPFSSPLCDAFPSLGVLSPLSLLGAAFLFLLLVSRVPSRRPLWLLLLALLPSLQLVPIMRWWSPHYFYVPFALGAVVLGDVIERRLENLRPALLLGLVVLASLSLVQGLRYRDDVALWAPEVAREPACREGHFYLGEAARNAHDFPRAALHYQRAIDGVAGHIAYLDEFAALQNLGAVELAMQHHREARLALGKALERASTPEESRHTTYDLALVALQAREPSEAVRLLEPETELSEPLPQALLLRARALHDLGREREAAHMLELAAATRGTR
ncbi:MAG: hypothetical protein QM756_46810 [Polyangiaceae bacterium]